MPARMSGPRVHSGRRPAWVSRVGVFTAQAGPVTTGVFACAPHSDQLPS